VENETTLNFGLVAHDDRKQALVDWVLAYEDELSRHSIYATGTTGTRLTDACPDLSIHLLQSGPHGGDQQLGAMICEQKLDVLIFFVDALSPHPHDVDVKALTRLAILYDIPQAYSESTANLIMKSLALGTAG
jgi:methylglyoxal synthase